MKYSLSDFFLGVVHTFVIFVPGGILLAAILYAFPLAKAEGDLRMVFGEAGAWLLAIAGAYMLGHLVSLAGSMSEGGKDDRRKDEYPDLRRVARGIVLARAPVAAQTGNIRRWAAVLLREDGSASFTEVERRDADRRFFRNIRLVLLLAGIALLSAHSICHVMRPDGPLLWLGLQFGEARSGCKLFGLLAVLANFPCHRRYVYLNQKYTELVFESLVAANDRVPVTTSSWERRWFVEGQPDRKLENWFDGRKRLPTEAHTDFYLQPTTAAVGIRLRGRGVETRVRVARTERAEQWAENCVALPNDVEECAGPDAPQWVRVNTKRRTVTLRLNKNKKKTGAGRGNKRSASGCRCMLTCLEVEGQPWWSFALVAFGPEGEQKGALEVCSEHVLAGHPGKHLDRVAPSTGYPEWIRSLELPRRPRGLADQGESGRQ